MKLSQHLSLRHSFVALLALAAATNAVSAQMYVDDDGPGDPFPGISVPGNPAFSDPAEDGSFAHPFDDLQKAISAATSGDEIIVLPSNVVGAYFVSDTIDLMGKNLTLRSQDGPAVTVLDGTSIPGQSGMSADQGEGPDMVIEGFHFRSFDRGTDTNDVGAGLEIVSSSPTVRNCWFSDNHAYRGAAAYVENSSSRFEDCRFEANASVHQGGAVYTLNGTPRFIRSIFEGNMANFGGAFLSRTNGSTLVTVRECVFYQNQSLVGYAGGLAKFDPGSIEITRSRFIANIASAEGGGVHLSGGGTVRDCTFNSNVSISNDGGGLSTISTGTHTVTGCTFYANVGGGLIEAPTVVITEITNCILWNNGQELSQHVATSYCNVLGGYGGAGNIDVDPVFQDANGPDNIQGNLDDDLRLFRTSPCIDAGKTTVLPVGYPKDLSGNPRAVDAVNVPDSGIAVVGHTTDMGAYEFAQPCPVGRVRF